MEDSSSQRQLFKDNWTLSVEKFAHLIFFIFLFFILFSKADISNRYAAPDAVFVFS